MLDRPVFESHWYCMLDVLVGTVGTGCQLSLGVNFIFVGYLVVGLKLILSLVTLTYFRIKYNTTDQTLNQQPN